MPWPTKKLGEVCEIIAGQAPPSRFYNKKGRGKPFLRINSFGDIFPQVDTWTTKCLKESQRGDVLFSVAGSLGFVNLGIDACITRSIFALRPRDTIIQKFLFHFLKLKGKEFGKGGRGSAQKIMTKTQVENFEILTPPLKIQKQIVARVEKLFEKIDKAKELRQKAQEETANIFTIALREIFSDIEKKRWQSDRIGNLIENIKTGTTPPSKVKKYYNGGIQWFTPGDLGNSKFLSSSARTITETALKEGKAKLFKKGTLLFVGIGATLGKVGIASNEISANQQITGLYFKKIIMPEFAYYWFFYNYDYIRSISPQATLPILNQEGLKNLIIDFPPLSEQKKIVAELNSLREKVEKLKQFQQTQLEELTELKQSILAKAFKGELK